MRIFRCFLHLIAVLICCLFTFTTAFAADTSCADGYHYKEGQAGLNVDASIAGTGYAAIGNDGNQDATNGGKTQSDYNLTANGTWGTSFSYGDITGKARCATNRTENYNEIGTPEGTEGKYCWCQIDGFTPTNGSKQSLSGAWVFHHDVGNADGCADVCAGRCANNLQYVDAFRAALLGSVSASPATCELEMYTITYNLDGGTNYANAPTTYTIETAITLSEPTKDGYTFAGWVDDNGNTITEIPLGSTGNITLTAQWTQDTPSAEFTITTTEMAAGTVFKFYMSAEGTFYVDWGDGNVETITRTNTTDAEYTHTYTNAGTYTIGFSGQATGYASSVSGYYSVGIPYHGAAISFYNNKNVAGISGSLGAIFGTLTTGTNIQPRFYYTFFGNTNLTGSIPHDLFAGISGSPASYMFGRTFNGCSGLSGEIPYDLFTGISGAPASSMFASTFSNCSGLTGSVPHDLFAGISGAPAERMFDSTFYGCSGLTGYIPYELFSGITGTRQSNDFSYTTSGASKLATTCPSGTVSATINTNPSFNSLDGHAICKLNCPAGTYLDNRTCSPCPSGMTSPEGSTSIEQCSCGTGYHLESGTNPLANVDASIAGVGRGYQNDSTGQYGPGSDATEKYGITEDQTWATEFSYGVVRGKALCSTTSGSSEETGTPDESTGKGQYCWCQIDGFTPTGGSKQSLSGAWVFDFDYVNAASCARNCADNCAYRLQNRAVFRAALLGSVGANAPQGPVCVVDTITVDPGQYLVKNTITGTQCPANSYCPGGTFTFSETDDQGLNACPDGTTSPAGSTSIEQCLCPENTYLDNGTCTACPDGATSDAGSTGIEQCLCPENTYLDNGTCSPCPDGTTSDAGSTSIEQCVPIAVEDCQTGYEKQSNMSSVPGISSSRNDGVWTVVFPYGDVSGVSACLDVKKSKKGTTDSSVNVVGGTSTGNYCWCKADGGVWTYDYAPTTQSACETNCTRLCGEHIRDDVNMRAGVFSGGTIANNCVGLTYSCPAGEYLDGDTCKTCEPGFWCPGDGDGGAQTYSYNGGIQGRNPCQDGGTSPAGATSGNVCECGDGYESFDPDSSENGTALTPSGNNWSASFDYGTLSGISACLSASGSTAGQTTTGSAHIPVTGDEDEGKYCWCKMEHLAESGWVFAYAPASVDACGKNCTTKCAEYVATKSAMRDSLFATMLTPNMCYSPKYSCDAGEYLDGDICKTCESGFWCPGGEWDYNGGIQGRNSCQSGATSNSGSDSETQCYCDAGFTEFLDYVDVNANDYSSSGNTWTINYDGWDVRGESACLDSKMSAKGDINMDLDVAGGTSTGKYCWCRTTDPIDGFWTYNYQPTSQDACNKNCAKYCGNYASSQSALRTGLFKSGYTTSCVARISCDDGEYLPAGSTSCAVCPAGDYCLAGSYSYSATNDQGNTSCPQNATSEEGATSCYCQDGYTNLVGLIDSGDGSSSRTTDTGWETSFSGLGVSGVSACLDVKKSSRGAFDAELDVEAGTVTGSNCWCKLSTPIGSYWTYDYSAASNSACETNCAKKCGEDTKSMSSLRVGLFNPDNQALICVAQQEIHCNDGEYLPANQSICAACPAGDYCLAGDYLPADIDQGNTTCAPNSTSTPGSTSCYCDTGYIKLSEMPNLTGQVSFADSDEWTTSFNELAISGVSACLDVKKSSRGIFDTELDVDAGTVTGSNCWCKLSTPDDSYWTYDYTAANNSACETNCAKKCGEDAKSMSSLRSGLLNNNPQDICVLKTYNITYETNGGTGCNYDIYSYGIQKDLTCVPEKSGYTFVGWYDSETGGKQVATIPGGTTGNQTVYARYADYAFNVTTTDDTTEFSFKMAASGTFYVDWGDGNNDVYTTTSVANKTYSHTYENADSYTIRIGGDPTSYSTNVQTATISFANNQNVAQISGSLGAIFKTLNIDETIYQPKFYATFSGCSNLEGTIPNTLFHNITGQPVEYMFANTFKDCSGLSGGIPSDLFKGISGEPKPYMFYQTFSGCSGLTGEIPNTLFCYNNSNGTCIAGAPAQSMFNKTFAGCSGLSGSIPPALFRGISGAPESNMFNGTFENCSGLSGRIPSNLFCYTESDGICISGAPANSMFNATFSGCSGLTGSISSGLFRGISGAPANNMFDSTFKDCSGLTGTIPANLFCYDGDNDICISGDPVYGMFYGTFNGASGLESYIPTTLFENINIDAEITNQMTGIFANTNLLQSCPANYYQYTTGFEDFWDNRVSCSPCPSGTTSSEGSTSIEQCSCGTGYHLESGTNPLANVDASIGGDDARWKSINGTGPNNNDTGLNNGDFETIFSYGNITGKALCSTKPGDNQGGTWTNPTTFDTLADETGTGQYCYCQIDGFTPTNGSKQSLSGAWVFGDDLGNADVCANFCANACAFSLQDLDVFRAALLGSVGANAPQGPVCVVDDITVDPGQYLVKNTITGTQCPENSYCPGGTFTFSETDDQGLNACPDGTVSPAGSTGVEQCVVPELTIIYNYTNGGSGCANETYTIGLAKELTCVPEKDNNVFIGWFDAVSGGNQITTISADATGNITVYAQWQSENVTYSCKSGMYMPANSAVCSICPVNHYCPGVTDVTIAANNQGVNTCPTNTLSPTGSRSIASCGRILHIGDEIVYLRQQQATGHALKIDIDQNGVADFFGNLTTTPTPMNINTQRMLHIGEYYLYDDTLLDKQECINSGATWNSSTNTCNYLYAGNTTINSYTTAKNRLLQNVYNDHRQTLYCEADFNADNTIPTLPDGFETSSYVNRSNVIEMEHIVPAENFGSTFPEWTVGDESCVHSDGTPFKGRSCAELANSEFRYMLSDMYNLYPAIGSVNARRSAYPFAELPANTPNSFGSCEVKISNNTVEPPVDTRGMIARTYLYFDAAYPHYTMPAETRILMEKWDSLYPVTDWECTRASRIEQIQGNANYFVKRRCAA